MKKIEYGVLKKSDDAYNEIMIDYSKYYERFVEGSSLSAYTYTPFNGLLVVKVIYMKS